MTCKEKFKEDIFELACEAKKIAVDKRTNRPCDCDKIDCTDCKFRDTDKSCDELLVEWCNAEYKEEFEKDELVEVSNDGRTWSLAYFSHIDENGRGGKYKIWNFGLTSKEALTTSGRDYCRKYGTLGRLAKGE